MYFTLILTHIEIAEKPIFVTLSKANGLIMH